MKVLSPYQLKKALMYPRKFYMRRRENLEPGFLRSALELHYYRPAFYDWLRAVNANDALLYEAQLDENSLVLDVGAYIGEWASEIAARYNPRILAFEPDPRNLRQLLPLAENNHRLTAYTYGLGDKTETLPMALQFLGSTVYADHVTEANQDWADVEIRDIHEVWYSLGLERVDLMKVNIEGAEFPLFERMIETELLDKVDCYLIQFHEWHPGAYGRRRRIRRELAKSHRPEWDYHFIWEKWVRK
ncbi:MAG: FkbM family methyltransferase [Halioglobus sp.]|nr:FkbM family methyltransferase [Halioglobus sp.]